MSKCRNCKIEILDRTGVCPLCHCVVEQDGSESGNPGKTFCTDRPYLCIFSRYGRGTVGIHQCKPS